jgi:hypothetical protein
LEEAMTPLEQLIQSSKENLAKLEAAAASAAGAITAPALSVKDMVAAEMEKYRQANPPPPVVEALAAAPPSELVMVQRLLLEIAAVFKKALPAEDFEYLQKHIAEGAPGSIPFLTSDTIKTLAIMVNDEYRAFLRGEAK